MLDKMTKLLWLDMEMTGLDIHKEVVIECACIVTDLDFRELDCFEAIVKQPQKYLDAMDAWNTQHHGASGLTSAVPNGMEPEAVEFHITSIIDRHFPQWREDNKFRPIMAGNSITQDRLFIDKYFPKIAERLHYRMLDVSSWKIIFNHKFDKIYRKQNAHRALGDIRESIGELRYYIDQIKTDQ